MPFPIGAAIMGGAALAGSALDAFMQNKTNKQNVNLANTAHQREVADLRAAGLNPILSAGGSGAPIPELKSPSSGIQNAVNTALAAKQANANIALTEAQTVKAGAEGKQASVNARIMEQTEEQQLQQTARMLQQQYMSFDMTKAQRDMLGQQILEVNQRIRALEWENWNSAMDVPRVRNMYQYESGPGGKLNPWLKVLGAGVGAATGINNLRLNERR